LKWLLVQNRRTDAPVRCLGFAGLPNPILLDMHMTEKLKSPPNNQTSPNSDAQKNSDAKGNGDAPKNGDSQRKRMAILEQAILTFAELGFRGTDVQVIADRAGVGKGTIYRYFGNKQDLFWATTFEVFERLDRYLETAMKGIESPARQLKAACMAYAGFFEAQPQYLEVFVQDRAEFRGDAPESHRQRHEKMIDHFATIIDRGIKIGEFRPLDIHKTIVSLGGVLYGTVVFGCYSYGDHTIGEMAEFAVDTFLEGIRAATDNTKESTNEDKSL
jgi:AcrR family transcriptional regulator